MKVFSGVQGEILNATKKNQLVSAGAGSGKTTVMIEKISNLLLKGDVEIDNLLVVTFTVLAAQEMKDRLIQKLKSEIDSVDGFERERILKIIEKIDTSSIDTIDGFASKTIKKYFYDLEISPNIEIISDATKDYYLSKAIKKTFEHSHHDENIDIMLDLFAGNRRNLEPLYELVLTNYYNIINIEDYEKFLDDCLLEYGDCVKSEKIVNDYICGTANKILREIIENYSVVSESVREKLKLVTEQLESFNSCLSLKSNLKLLFQFDEIKFSANEYKENVGLKSLNSKIEKILEIKNDLKNNKINENYEENNEKIIIYLQIFIKLLKKFIKNYNNIKQKNNLIDFNDLNRLMLKLLKNENIKIDLQNKFKYIFIDEYQDVNPLQDKLMTELTGENTTVFMVGDVKQSIYGFRGSSPEWFLNKYNKMKKNQAVEDVFDMNVNFRSSPTILNFINLIFNKLMTKQSADIDYERDCNIEPMRNDILDDKVKILLVEEEKSSKCDKGLYSVKNHSQDGENQSKNKEALLVAKIITELVGSEFYDANLKVKRKLTYKDIAILTHSDKDESSCDLIDILNECAIPLNINNKLEISSSEIMKLILSILKCVNNTADDVDYLATFMSLTDLTMDDIVSFRDKNFSFYENLLIIHENLIKNDVFLKINSGFEILDDIYKASCSLTNKELILYILNNHKLKYFILRKPNGEKELNLVEEFLMKLSSIEDSLGLAEFIEVVESNVSSSGDFLAIDKEDSVTLQTIHKSKGLEYPVVILFNSSKVFAYLREHDAINFNSNIGLGVDYFDTANRIKMDSLTKYAIRLENNQKGYKEELRLLYVALTRAKNKLFITGTISKREFSDIKKTSYTNMLLSCFADQITGDKLEGETFELEFISDVAEFKSNENKNIRNVKVVGQNFVYPYEHQFSIPFKNTVTGINSESAQDNSYEIKKVTTLQVQYDTEDKAKIGVDYHSALEKLDLTAPYKQNTNFETIDYNKIRLAHEKLSPLIKDAIKVKKEAEFMMFVPYNEVVSSDVEDKVLIQGVVDLIIEKENSVILIDYKFSSLPAKVLKEKYAEQLRLYKFAIEEAFKKPVESMFIYSINTGELV